MTDVTVSRTGQINLAGDAKALYLKVFAGEVITTFNANCVFQDKHMTRQIASGKSAQFPAIGKIGAGYHTPGSMIQGTPIAHNEKVITIDDLLLASVFIADIDEASQHYDVRSEYTKQIGEALAVAYDKNVARVSVLNARDASTIAGLNGGTTLKAGVNVRTDAALIKNAFFAAARKLDENDVPGSDRYAFMRPITYYAAAASPDLLNKDWGGAGSIAKGTFETLAGITAVKTNNLPNTDESADAGVLTKYRGNYANTAMLIQNRAAVGTVKLMDLSMQSDYLTTHQASLLVGRYAVGHGGLRPDCGIEVAAVAP